MMKWRSSIVHQRYIAWKSHPLQLANLKDRMMNTPQKLVILTGAGMSAESGIPTFRGADGLWEGHRVEEVATPEAWLANPALVLKFYNERRKHLLKSQPNEGHVTLTQWEQHMDVQIITQNVDDLHERAGSTQVLHLHGRLIQARSTGPGSETFPMTGWEMKASDRCPKGYPVRPDIVWFGEDVPAMTDAIALVRAADCVLIIGTSMQVYPAANLAFEAAAHVPLHVIDPAADALPAGHAIRWPFGASVGLKKWAEAHLRGGLG
jgi:NAD-dependent deacetylase